MCADRDSSSSPGLRALLGRFLHGLLQYRVFQLFGAAWSYLMGLAGASFLSLLPSAWMVHRSVGPDDLPEMLEALGLRSKPWEELEECLEELGPWKELLSPAMKADLEMMNSWKGYVSSSKEQETWDTALEELGTWHSKMQVLWEPGLGTWTDPDQEEECHSKSSSTNTKIRDENGLSDVDSEKNGARLASSSLGMVSCIFNPGSAGVFTWLELGNEQNIHDKDRNDEPSVLPESKMEIEHIRNKRLWFLQQNQSQDSPITELKHEKNPAENQESFQNGCVLREPPILTKLDLPVPSWHNGHQKDLSPDCQLLSDLDHSSVLKFPAADSDCKPCHPLHLLVPKLNFQGNGQNKYPPSPDQDQGYHSLEDWQCLNIKQDILLPEVHDGPPMPTGLSCSDLKDLKAVQDSDDVDSDVEEEIPAPTIPVCTNKHIAYILGTAFSDDEDPNSSCEDDDWGEDDDDDDDDDGFDSEGSVSATETDPPVPEEVVLWNSFSSSDPYNPQNFTATLQTGPVAEVNSELEDHEAVTSDEEESWCDSDAVSDSDSEDEFSADEQENLKLWNGFLKSEDPYNPLFFKAPVQTSELKRQNTKILDRVCTNPSSCEMTVATHPNNSQLLQLREMHSVSMEESANARHKKVTFNDKVTVYYVCNEEERKGHWEEFARDRCRFQRRIQETESVIGHCFTPDHRQRVWNRMQEIWGS
ncbi:protein phosphatase 1 regulatory subunit 15B [Engystomops pustulosus]|uniref:protein phosphatase 1 regulatory subunit 15B n=1 Tax=Engystomops pustulosus TaxID=76066 RepID=UPI003AFA7E75